MKTLDGKEIKRGDQLLAPGDKNVVVMGEVHQQYDATDELRVGGHNLRLRAGDTVHAKSAFDAYTAPLFKARAKADAAATAAVNAGAAADVKASQTD